MKKDIIYGFITVRTSSTRLPNKCLLPLGNESVIEHVIKRCLTYSIEPIVCTTSDSSDDVIEKISNKLNVKCFRGSSINKLKRWADCAKHYKIQDFHTVDADDPFFDGDEMKTSMKQLREGNYDIVTPTFSSSSGGASVGYSLKSKVVLEATKNTNDSTDTEMIESFLEELKNLKTHNLQESAIRPSNVRLTLDYEEDYLLLKVIIQILGKNNSRDQIDNLFVTNPDLSKINWFRNVEWKAKQNLKTNK
jgi:spore coat polysaccharide biosynthesis protein SpsF